jgi:hypothetical protein
VAGKDLKKTSSKVYTPLCQTKENIKPPSTTVWNNLHHPFTTVWNIYIPSLPQINIL